MICTAIRPSSNIWKSDLHRNKAKLENFKTWSKETIDDLVGKISVKRRDNESIFRTQQETIKRNEGEDC